MYGGTAIGCILHVWRHAHGQLEKNSADGPGFAGIVGPRPRRHQFIADAAIERIEPPAAAVLSGHGNEIGKRHARTRRAREGALLTPGGNVTGRVRDAIVETLVLPVPAVERHDASIGTHQQRRTTVIIAPPGALVGRRLAMQGEPGQGAVAQIAGHDLDRAFAAGITASHRHGGNHEAVADDDGAFVLQPVPSTVVVEHHDLRQRAATDRDHGRQSGQDAARAKNAPASLRRRNACGFGWNRGGGSPLMAARITMSGHSDIHLRSIPRA